MSARSLLSMSALVLVLAAPRIAHADDAHKEKLARQLMAETGAADLGKQVMQSMLAQFRKNPQISKEFIDKFTELAKPEQIVELVVPIYVRTYDEETLQAAVDFYGSPAGKKLVAGLPLITQQSMAVGQQWGMQIAQQTQAALQAQAPGQAPAAR